MKRLPYRNPVIPGFHPDPSVCRVGADYYLVTSSFEFFPGIPIFHSKNLVNWELVSHAITRDEQVNLVGAGASRGLYAPTIRHHDGEFYVTVTKVDDEGNVILRSGDVTGPWSNPVRVDQGGIDPSLFFDDDGTAYFCSNATVDGRMGIALSVVNPITGELKSPIRHICAGSGGSWPEAPHLYKFHGLYYLALAEGGTEYGHMETIFRSSSPWGPYVACPRNPILTNRNETDNPIHCVGHADIFDDANGNPWAVCLGARPLDGLRMHNLGRETFLAPVVWDEDLWPVVGDGGRIRLEMEGALPAAPGPRAKEWIPSFSMNEGADLEWNFVRNPERSRYRFHESAKTVELRGSEKTLSEAHGSPTFIGRRQEEIDCVFSARVALAESAASVGEAGIAAYYNDAYHYEIFARENARGETEIAVRKKIHDLEAETCVAILPSKHAGIQLRVRADQKRYRFDYALEDGDWIELGSGMTAGLCTEGTHTMTFTGVYLGIFAIRSTATFADIRYENV